jgi:hypothetical protein
MKNVIEENTAGRIDIEVIATKTIDIEKTVIKMKDTEKNVIEMSIREKVAIVEKSLGIKDQILTWITVVNIEKNQGLEEAKNKETTVLDSQVGPGRDQDLKIEDLPIKGLEIKKPARTIRRDIGTIEAIRGFQVVNLRD